MASGRVAKDILREFPEDEKQRHLWRYVLDKRFDKIEKGLNGSDILTAKSNLNNYVATYQADQTDADETICKLLHNESYGLIAVHTENQAHIYPANEQVMFYPSETARHGWIVGPKSLFQGNDNRGGASDANEQKQHSSVSRDYFDPIRLSISQEDQALFYVTSLGEHALFKQPNVTVRYIEAHFGVDIEVQTDNEQGLLHIKNQLSELFSSFKKEVDCKTISLDKTIITFMMSEPVLRFVNERLNGRNRPVTYAFYMDANDNTVTVYSRVETMKKFNVGLIEKAVQCSSFPIDPIVFSDTDIQNEMVQLESKYKGKLKLSRSLSENFTLSYVFTEDKASLVQFDIKTLVKTRTIGINGQGKKLYCKKHFKHFKKVLQDEKKLKVKVVEEETTTKYGFIIKGGTKSTDFARNWIQSIVDKIVVSDKDFKTDDDSVTLENQLMEKIDEAFNITEMKYGFNEKDMQKEVDSLQWDLPNGNIEVINSGKNWIAKDTMVLVQIQLEDLPNNKGYLLDENTSTLTFSLKPWTNNKIKSEIQALVQTLDDLIKTPLPRKFCKPKRLCLMLNDLTVLGWPWKYFLIELLRMIDKCTLCLSLVILEPGRPKFESAKAFIEKQALKLDEHNRFKIDVKTGELARQKVDIIVNSTSNNLQLKNGAVSTTILKGAGDEIQKECNRKLADKISGFITSKDVIWTKGYNLPCKYVFHGALETWGKQTLGEFVRTCLEQADYLGMSTIAFPSLGTGNLQYPSTEVAKIMFNTVAQYSRQSPNGSLKQVMFVIYEKDFITRQAFLDENDRVNGNTDQASHKYVASKVKCPKYHHVRITIAGDNRDIVEKTFDDIEIYLKNRDSENDLDNQNDTEGTLDEYTEDDENDEKQQEGGFCDGARSRDKTSSDSDDACLALTILDANGTNTYWKLVSAMKEYDVQEDKIIWCPITPNEARIKLRSQSELDRVFTALSASKSYSATRIDAEAITNIRARLAQHTMQFLQERNSFIPELEKQSGVKVETDSASIVLSGSLVEITSARHILRNWMQEQKVIFVTKENFDFPTETNKNEINEIQTNTVKSKQQRSPSLTNVDNHSTLEIPKEPGDRIVVTEENSLRIYVKTDTKSQPESSLYKDDDVKLLSVKASHVKISTDTSERKTNENQEEKENEEEAKKTKMRPNYENSSAVSGNDPKKTENGTTGKTETESSLSMTNMEGKRAEDAGNIPSNANNCNRSGVSNLQRSSNSGISSDTSNLQRSSTIGNSSDASNLQRSSTGGNSSDASNLQRDSNTGNDSASASNSSSGNNSGARPKDKQNAAYGTREKKNIDDNLMMETREGIKVFVYQGNICHLDVNGIVNSSNEDMKFSSGLSKVILNEAGQAVADECESFLLSQKRRFTINDVFCSTPGKLQHYMNILHVCSPVWTDTTTRDVFSNQLGMVITNALNEANELHMISIALPAIGSGGRGGPKQLCFYTYAEAVKSYSATIGKKSTLKNIHFVDVGAEVVNMMQTAFILAAIATTPNEESKSKLKKIPEKIKNTFDKFLSFINVDVKNPTHITMQFLNGVSLTVCEGGLFTSFKHRHTEFSEWNFYNTGVLVTENKEFSGQSKSMALCYQRGGNEFSKNFYVNKKHVSKQKKKIGNVFDTFGDSQLNFGFVLCVFLPTFDEKCFNDENKESHVLLEQLDRALSNTLVKTDKLLIEHLCFPFLAEDFYHEIPDWFMSCCVEGMIKSIKEFSDKRKSTGTLLLHLPLNGNKKLFKEFRRCCGKTLESRV